MAPHETLVRNDSRLIWMEGIYYCIVKYSKQQDLDL